MEGIESEQRISLPCEGLWQVLAARASVLLVASLFCGASCLADSAQGKNPQPRITMPAPAALEFEAAALEKAISNQVHLATHQPPVEEARPLHPLKVVLGIGLAVAGFLGVRKLAPWVGEILSRRYDPWCEGAARETEENFFLEFVKSFTTGPRREPAPDPATASSAASEVTPASAAPKEANGVDPLQEFLTESARSLASIRKLVSELGRVSDEANRKSTLAALTQQIVELKSKANLPSVLPAWQMAGALGGLVTSLAKQTGPANPSTLRTVACAVDLLHALCVRGVPPNLASEPPARILAVDDDPISRHALSFSLKKVFTQPDLAADGESALLMAAEQAYDVVFLDVQMPRMDGFEVCSRIHGTPLNQTTPVVFVTSCSDFSSRAKSTLIGGQDLLGKPFLTFELTVKALTLIMRSRLQLRALAARPASAPVGDLNGSPQVNRGSSGNSHPVAHQPALELATAS